MKLDNLFTTEQGVQMRSSDQAQGFCPQYGDADTKGWETQISYEIPSKATCSSLECALLSYFVYVTIFSSKAKFIFS